MQPASAMNSRRLMASPRAEETTSSMRRISHLGIENRELCRSLDPSGPAHHVRFGSKADIRPKKRDVRFTPKSGHQQSNTPSRARPRVILAHGGTDSLETNHGRT